MFLRCFVHTVVDMEVIRAFSKVRDVEFHRIWITVLAMVSEFGLSANVTHIVN